LGRDQDLAEVHALIGQHRLVTLTGAGGTGKTRLAVEAARRAAGGVAGGVWLGSPAGIEGRGLGGAPRIEGPGVPPDPPGRTPARTAGCGVGPRVNPGCTGLGGCGGGKTPSLCGQPGPAWWRHFSPPRLACGCSRPAVSLWAFRVR